MNMPWFSHSTSAKDDPKVKAIRKVYGAEGYAYYFMLLEIIYANGGTLDLSSDIMHDSVADSIGMQPEEMDLFIGDCADIGLFDSDHWKTYQLISKGIAERMATYARSQKGRSDGGKNSGETRRRKAERSTNRS